MKPLLSGHVDVHAPGFWEDLRVASVAAQSAADVIALSSLRRRAERLNVTKPTADQRLSCRVALLGAYASYPLSEIVSHFLATSQPPMAVELLLGEFDNYVSEVMEADGALVQFKPDVVIMLPSAERCRFDGPLTASSEIPRSQAAAGARAILELASLANQRTGARIILGNFPLPPGSDPGPIRGRSLGTDWTFRKIVNLLIGEEAPAFVTICDLEFLSARRGVARAADDQAWFESKQLGSSEFLVDAARELARLVVDPFRPPAKVVALDLDNTLWGGVIGDDGLDGIVLGGANAVAESYRALQQHLRSLKSRGFLLAVVSKNDAERAVEPFNSHPDMVLRLDDIVSFKASWGPKPESLRAIAQELNLGLDSFVFIDDSAAEIEHVRQVLPEVHCILLDADPAKRLQQLRDSEILHVRALTAEAVQRTTQYHLAARRQELESSADSFDAYLQSLAMVAEISAFRSADISRIAELTARSNQFNLTTIRRPESDLIGLMTDRNALPFSIRLRDRFGDYGLISVVIGCIQENELVVDTWLMSCRALKRQVEHEAFNELLRLGRQHGLEQIRGVYVPTAKNGMVRDLYTDLGFRCVVDGPHRREFVLQVESARPFITKIAREHRREVADNTPSMPTGKTRPVGVPGEPKLHFAGARTRETDPARPGVEAEVAAIWGEVFGIPPPDRTANFFELGGDSLQAMRLHLLLCSRFPEVPLAVADIYRSPTLAALSARLGARPSEAPTSGRAARPEPVYFGAKNGQLFGMFHHGLGPVRGAVLCCYPMPPKYQRSYRLFHQCAGELAGQGYDVLRFDYSGTGDSSGEPAEATIEKWTGEVEAAADYLRSRSQTDRVSIVGMRLGAALAARASRRISTIDKLVLWEPAVDGEEYLNELRALNAYHGNGDHIGNGLDFHGFLMTPEFQRTLSALSLVESPPVASQILLIESKENPASLRLHTALRNAKCETIPGIDWDSVFKHDQIIVAPAHLQRIVQFLTEQRA
jgi:FkbH-like protein